MATIKVSDIAYARVRLPDLESAENFFTDFGLIRAARTEQALYMRACDTNHHVLIAERGEDKFLGLAFHVRDESDLEAATTVPGASDIETRNEPGGGKRVRLRDPDGNGLEIVWGMETSPPIVHQLYPLNDAREGLRRAGALTRHTPGPSKVLRLGHGVLMSTNPGPMIEWYRQHLGLLCSDEVRVDGHVGLSFHRLDRGEEFVDHHVLLIQAGPAGGLNHCGFEVQDIDDLMLGHDHLKRKGYDSVWGIGRHVFGAQVFDYWMDPWGFMFEHWTDTDRINAEFVGRLDATVEDANGPWGMDVPQRFFTHAHP